MSITEGPWKILRDGEEATIYHDREDGSRLTSDIADIAYVCINKESLVQPMGTTVEGEANARAISAVPEMMEALERFIYRAENECLIEGAYECVSYLIAELDMAKQALAKAKGEGDEQ